MQAFAFSSAKLCIAECKSLHCGVQSICVLGQYVFLLCVIESIVETDSSPFVDGVQQDMQPIRPLTRSQSVDLFPSVLSVSSAFLVLLEPTKIDRISGLGHYKSRWRIDEVWEIHTSAGRFWIRKKTCVIWCGYPEKM